MCIEGLLFQSVNCGKQSFRLSSMYTMVKLAYLSNFSHSGKSIVIIQFCFFIFPSTHFNKSLFFLNKVCGLSLRLLVQAQVLLGKAFGVKQLPNRSCELNWKTNFLWSCSLYCTTLLVVFLIISQSKGNVFNTKLLLAI